jgi:CobQ-like glutamine amidotransferase family enzyme
VTAVRLCHLYPGEMNIYADRGNIAVLARRAAWRGHVRQYWERAA